MAWRRKRSVRGRSRYPERLDGALVKADADWRELIAGREHLIAHLEGLFARYDLVDYDAADKTDQRPSAALLVLRGQRALSAAELQQMIHGEFVDCFEEAAGPLDRYAGVAQETWDLWMSEGLTERPPPHPL
jgi:hypothetical protein